MTLDFWWTWRCSLPLASSKRFAGGLPITERACMEVHCQQTFGRSALRQWVIMQLSNYLKEKPGTDWVVEFYQARKRRLGKLKTTGEWWLSDKYWLGRGLMSLGEALAFIAEHRRLMERMRCYNLRTGQIIVT